MAGDRSIPQVYSTADCQDHTLTAVPSPPLPPPPRVTLSCCDTSGAPGALPDFALLPQDQTVTSWRLTTASSVQSLNSKIRTPASQTLLCCDFFCSITSLISHPWCEHWNFMAVSRIFLKTFNTKKGGLFFL